MKNERDDRSKSDTKDARKDDKQQNNNKNYINQFFIINTKKFIYLLNNMLSYIMIWILQQEVVKFWHVHNVVEISVMLTIWMNT